MKQYLDLGRDILENGNTRSDRTGTGTISVFGRQIRFDLSKGDFPLLTTKKMFLKGIIHELLWFIRGDTNNNSLEKEGVTIWREWATEDGSLGPIYGKQFRNFGGVDQIAELIENLKKKPFSRRHVVSAWNPPELPDETISPQDNVKNGKMALAACHCLFQFYVQELNADETIEFIEEKGLYNQYINELNNSSAIFSNECEFKQWSEFKQWREKWKTEHNIPKYKLSCQLYQRSADAPLGVPYNIASYALLTLMIAQCVNMVPGEFVHTFGDVHVYNNQIEKFKEQLERKPLPLPKMKINPEVKDIFSFKFEDFELVDYQSHPKIDYPISV